MHSRTHFVTCPLCEAMCGLAVRTEGEEIRDIRGDADDPFSRGHVCPKAVALADVHRDPDRLRQPLRRTAGGGWEPLGWDAALDLAADRLAAVQAAHGRDAVAIYLGNPTAHGYAAALAATRLSRALGTRQRYSATSVDQLPHHLVANQMFGHQLLIPIPDLDRTAFFLVLGANPVASNGSLMTAPGMKRRLTELRAEGGRLVVVDPRRTETAALADLHLPIRPGTDALLLLAMLEVLFAEDLVTPGRLRDLTDGWEELAPLVARYPPERVATVTGIAASTIRQLARDFASAARGTRRSGAVCYGRFGLSTQEHGTVALWLVQVLNLVTGNLDREGGAMFTRPAFDLVALTARLGMFGQPGKRHTRVRGLPSFGSELPVATLAEEILTPLAPSTGPATDEPASGGAVRALVTVAGNPVLSTPNGGQLDRALERLDFMVSVDLYLNETTRHAHLVLPPTFGLERDHYDAVFHLLAVRNTAKYAPPVFARGPEQRHDHEILAGIAHRLERRPAAASSARRPGTLARTATAWLTPRRLLALGLRFGPWGAGWNPFARGLTLSRLARAPHGIDLGPLTPCLPERLFTPDRRIRLMPAMLVDDLQRLDGLLGGAPEATSAEGSLALIGRRHVRSNNSWMHNSHRLVKGPPRCTLLIHPADAASRAIADGSAVRVRSRVGSIATVAEVTTDVQPGVVSLPHGWGHARPGVHLTVAAAHAGASINDLTDELRVDPLSGNAAFTGVPVWVEPGDPNPAASPALGDFGPSPV